MKALSLILLTGLVLAACQSTPPTSRPSPAPSPAPTAAPDVSTIGVSADGFSPLADAPHNTISFDVRMSRPDTVTKWTVTVSGPNGVVRTVDGNKTLPGWSWDGTTDGVKLIDGSYHAQLTVFHGDQTETAQSNPFLVDMTPPSGTVTVSPRQFTGGPANGGNVTFQLALNGGGASVTTWRLLVMHPDGRKFTDFISENHNDNTVVWDGRDQSNNTLELGTTYQIVVQIVDQYGNKGTANTVLPVNLGTVATPVTVSLNGAVVAQLQVYFPAYSADMNLVDAPHVKSNAAALDKLAGLLKKTPGVSIRVVGHANQVLWQDPEKAHYEQTETLIPLSKARADAVLAALTKQGLDAARLDVTGVGAEGNVVPFSDAAQVWKNRRVEFLLKS